MKFCQWEATAARGVYKLSCQPEGVLGVPPAPGQACQWCGGKVTILRPKGPTPTLADFRKWQAEQREKSAVKTSGGAS